jgi:hypothetical protein
LGRKNATSNTAVTAWKADAVRKITDPKVAATVA